ncbi:MAG: ASKHA domain-containing protein, partial [Chloroflexota bacterium]
MASHRIEFEPLGRRGDCPADSSLLDCAHRLGVGLNSVCGGRGLCSHCKVQLLEGAVSDPTSAEQKRLSPGEIEQGYRLACQTYPRSDCKLRVPTESMSTQQRVQTEGAEFASILSPPVRCYDVEMAQASLSDLRGDAERVLQTLEQQHGVQCRGTDIDVLRNISPVLRSCDWRVQAAVRGQEVVALSATSTPQLGLAVDLGTTKIAGYLVDFATGRTLATQGVMNPQIGYGEDIVSRLTRVVGSESEREQMRSLAVDALNELTRDLCAQASAEAEWILEAEVVGNTAMHHLLLGLPVEQLSRSPFVSALHDSADIKARDLGLTLAPGAHVHLLPNIAGFVGADHVAMILATDLLQLEGLTLALDMGTNTEVCLADNGRITSVSCASGPAFEGGHIRDGMRAAPGAIEHLEIMEGEVGYQTVDGAAPVGLCGSGILDTLAHLYVTGIVNGRGRILEEHSRVRTSDGQRQFVIVSEDERNGGPAIVLTQKDVRELQLAKAAIHTGIKVLLDNCGRKQEELDRVLVAGAFGTYVDVTSAITIGMLPDLPLDRF